MSDIPLQAPSSPVKHLSKDPSSPVNQFPEDPSSPVNKFPETPVGPVNHLSVLPVSPISQVAKAPLSPVNQFLETPPLPVKGSDELLTIRVNRFVEADPISTLVIIIAMQAEALPLVNKFELHEDLESVFPKGAPWVRYHGVYKDLNINIIWPGKDPSFGVDSVGTVSASLVTYASIQALQPDLIINAGTAGGFKAKGACIGDVFLATDVAFHDRRIPIPVFDLYGVGSCQSFSTPNIIEGLNIKVGKLSTGDSLDMTTQDEASIFANDATLKDMEGAAIAYVANLFKVPVVFIKAVTDIVDGDKPTTQEFLQNLIAVTAALDLAVTQVVDFISGKSLSEL